VTTPADVWGEGAAQRTDVDWIRWAGAHRRVALTADESILFLKAKRDAIVAVRLQAFCFPHHALAVSDQVGRVLAQQRAMRRLVAERPGPWLAALYDGHVEVKWAA
jgi:PIN like domain